MSSTVNSTPPPPGVYVPAVIFFDEDEELDLPSIKAHVLRLAKVRAHCWYPCTTRAKMSSAVRRMLHIYDVYLSWFAYRIIGRRHRHSRPRQQWRGPTPLARRAFTHDSLRARDAERERIRERASHCWHGWTVHEGDEEALRGREGSGREPRAGPHPGCLAAPDDQGAHPEVPQRRE